MRPHEFDGATIPEWIRHAARQFGEREWVVLGDERMSFAEAERRSGQLARRMLAAGVGKGSRVGLLLPNGPDFVVAWLAASRIGALVVPICTYYQSAELAWTLRHADVHLLLTAPAVAGHDLLDRLEQAGGELGPSATPNLRLSTLPYLRHVWVLGPHERAWATRATTRLDSANELPATLDDEFLSAIERDVTPADPALLVYTSGSTADPKGVVHGHGTLVRHAHRVNTRRGLESSDRLYTPMPFFWLGGLHTALLSAMTVGACVLCEERFDPPETLSMLERERATLVLGWPYHGKALRDDPGFAARDLGALRAGARNAIPPTRDEIADPELRPNWLGMTEAFGPHCMSEMDRALPEAARGSFGPPLPDFEHVIVDPDTGRALDAGETGEICFRGGSLMQALYKVERQDTFDPDGFYHTGDGGRFDAQGRLFFTGRLGDTIKTAGANVSPREVELALETCPTVKEAYVVGLPDPQRGEVVAAALVAHAGAAVDAEEVRAKVRAELAAFKVPRILVPLAKDELPETATGKIRKDRLRDLLIERLER